MAWIDKESKAHSNCFAFTNIISSIGLKSVHLVSQLSIQCRMYPYTIFDTITHAHFFLLLYTALSQGDTVAFQSFTRNQWLSCFRDQCDVGRCPGMYFMQRDWTNCRGAVFRIYRMKGPGYVTVGDFIGIRYPREDRQWLGCTADMCAKSGCPGKPTDKNGFASEEHWLRCTGEVFRIYAMGKKEDEIINSGDDIMLYYLQGNTWLSLGDENVVKATCPGISRPPGQNRYDECATEVFRIVKRD